MNLSHNYYDTGQVVLHYVRAGQGKPVVLLHGWPQSWYCWHKIMPALAQRYSIIAPDLRGLGDSSRPLDGYDKATVAEDIRKLVHEHLEINRYDLVAHDWGGPVAFALAATYPEHVRKLVMLDTAVPGDGSGTFSQHGRRWHHAFHQTADLPEALVAGREDIYLGWFYRNYGYQPGAIAPSDEQEYLRTYRQPGALRAGFAYYRALQRDVAHNEALLKKNGKLSMPVLALGGGKAFGRGIETLQSLQKVANDVRGGVIDDCGHWMQEEKPDEVTKAVLDFFSDT
ncbi:MAG: alpha/beta hydrolase [Betaproteobacteria bacterium]|nr:MAG: alpha/beta hydrolase [Betaproteobacteria bacterium]